MTEEEQMTRNILRPSRESRYYGQGIVQNCRRVYRSIENVRFSLLYQCTQRNGYGKNCPHVIWNCKESTTYYLGKQIMTPHDNQIDGIGLG